MTRMFLLALAFGLTLPGVAVAQASSTALTDVRIAYFSPQRAFALSADGKAAQTRLMALQAERAREIEARNKTLAEARTQRSRDVEKFEIDLQRFIQDAQAELTGVQQELEGSFLAKLRPALDGVAREKGLWLVFNEDAGLLAWSDPALDITSEVVSRLR